MAGNYEEAVDQCFVDEELIDLVLPPSEGWAFVNEGTEIKKKQGYVTTEPNKTLSLKLDMTGMTQNLYPGAPPGEHINAHDFSESRHVSVTFMSMFEVEVDNSRKKCTILVTTLPETSSGEHKFKVTAVMLAQAGMNGFGWTLNNEGGWFRLEDAFVENDEELIKAGVAVS
eukprot:gene13442-19300_t